MLGDGAEPLGVEVGQRQVTDLALALQVGEVAQRIEIALVAIIPPVELQ